MGRKKSTRQDAYSYYEAQGVPQGEWDALFNSMSGGDEDVARTDLYNKTQAYQEQLSRSFNPEISTPYSWETQNAIDKFVSGDIWAGVTDVTSSIYDSAKNVMSEVGDISQLFSNPKDYFKDIWGEIPDLGKASLFGSFGTGASAAAAPATLALGPSFISEDFFGMGEKLGIDREVLASLAFLPTGIAVGALTGGVGTALGMPGLTGTISGAAAGGATGLGRGYALTGDFEEALQQGGIGALLGGAGGAISDFLGGAPISKTTEGSLASSDVTSIGEDGGLFDTSFNIRSGVSQPGDLATGDLTDFSPGLTPKVTPGVSPSTADFPKLTADPLENARLIQDYVDKGGSLEYLKAGADLAKSVPAAEKGFLSTMLTTPYGLAATTTLATTLANELYFKPKALQDQLDYYSEMMQIEDGRSREMMNLQHQYRMEEISASKQRGGGGGGVTRTSKSVFS